MMRKITAILMALLMLLTAAAGALADGGILRPGDTGDEVLRIQKKLIELEYLKGEATGVYDEATAAAVLLFQQEHGLLETGIADEVTRRELEAETRHAWNARNWVSADVSCTAMPMEAEEAGAMYDVYMETPAYGRI